MYGENRTVVSWKAVCPVLEKNIPVYEEVLSVLNAVTDVSPVDEKESWVFTAFLEANIDPEKIKEVFLHAAQASGDTNVAVEISPVYEDDYQSCLKQNFDGFCVGSFFIHNGLDWVSHEMVEVVIPAEMAFGTGEHPTTEACLLMYEKHSENHDLTNGLDMGCGSAVLSIAAAKLHGTKFLAVDNHAQSVEIAKDNVAVNEVSDLITVAESDGFQSAQVLEGAPYDLIFANILAEPLLQMSDDLARVLQPNGVAILSGFLEDQKEKIYTAYQKNGCKVIEEMLITNKVGTWVSAVVCKK